MHGASLTCTCMYRTEPCSRVKVEKGQVKVAKSTFLCDTYNIVLTLHVHFNRAFCMHMQANIQYVLRYRYQFITVTAM